MASPARSEIVLVGMQRSFLQVLLLVNVKRSAKLGWPGPRKLTDKIVNAAIGASEFYQT